MDVAIFLVLLGGTYMAAVYNRLQRLWHAVQEGLANVEAAALDRADLIERLADLAGRSGDPQQLSLRLAAVEQDLHGRRERCNADVRAYNTYRAQVPHILMSRLAGFGKLDFVPVDRADGSSSTGRESGGPRAVPVLASKRLAPKR
jgi:hypothetical protein